MKPPKQAKYVNMRKTFGDLRQEGGLPMFWKGAVPRCMRIIGAVFILNKANSVMSKYFIENNILM